MDAKRPFSGFSEVPHTADIAIDVYAPDLPGLFRAAAMGLYHILGIRKGTGEPESVHFSIEEIDEESLLISFLNELLYYANKGQVAEDSDINITGRRLEADLNLLAKTEQRIEIKAATFNNLKIARKHDGLRARIVFDI